MKYFIDGYNLLFRLKTQEGSSFQKQRSAFLQELSAIFNFLTLNVTIILDGKEEHLDYETRKTVGHVEILYTRKEQTADLYLLNIAFSKHPEPITIVTSDLVLAKQCKAAGVKILTIEAFMRFLEKKLSKEKNFKEKKPRSYSKEIDHYLAIFEKRLLEESDY